ncbi:MAG: phospholipid carrier-dependent glycosyltransferase [Kiritimatiellae bacterium]|nr:phospholipid carrier-dependent glycosyltransferase [Kiritimatiellia bacterium]
MRAPRRAPLWLFLAFLLGQLPLAWVGFKEHADEKHYTDAALLMLENKEYLTPRTYTGELRPNKPLGTYWFVLAGFKTLGVSLFASRLPSVLAGVWLLYLVYRMGLVVTGNPAAATLAVALQASDVTFWMLSNRATPDIFLTCGLTLGFLGLARQLKAASFKPGTLFLVLVGSGLAVMAKGLLGVVFLVFSLCALHVRFPKTLSHYRFWILGGIGIWLLGIGVWFVSMGTSHGMEFYSGFVYDQVVGRVVNDQWYLKPLHMLAYLAMMPLFFLFWLPWLIRRGVPSTLRHPEALASDVIWFWTVVAWSGVLCVIFGMGNKVTTRYVMSAVPLWSVLLADAACAVPGPSPTPWPTARKRWISVLLGMTVVAGLSVPVTGSFSPYAGFAAVCLFGIVAIGWGLRSRAEHEAGAAAAIAVVAWGGLPLVAMVAHVPLTTSPEKLLVEAIEASQVYHKDAGILTSDLPRQLLARTRMVHGHFCDTRPVVDFVLEERPIDTMFRLLPKGYTGPADLSLPYDPVETWSLAPGSPNAILNETWEDTSFPEKMLRLLRSGYPSTTFVLEKRR